MFVRNVVTLIAATVLVIGAICNDARAQTSSNASTDASAKALEVLDQGFKCPRVARKSKTGGYIHTRVTTSSTRAQIKITEETDFFSEQMSNGHLLVERWTEVEEYSARWADIDDVADYRTVKNVFFSCRDGKECITASDLIASDESTSSATGRLPSRAGQRYKNSEARMAFEVCDADTATNIRTAAEFLIKLSGGNVGQLYKVRKDVATGVLNMRTEPNASSPLVVAVPADTANVRVNRCRSYPGSNAPWCEAEWQGNKGWISGCCMVNAKTGKPAREKAAED